MKNSDIYWRRYKQHCTQDNDVSVCLKVGPLGPHTVLQIAVSCPIVFSWISSMVLNLFPFKGNLFYWFYFGKSQKSQGTKSGLEGLSHLGCQSLLIAACICSTLSGVLLVAGLPECGYFKQTLNHIWSICVMLIFALHSLHHSKKPSESSK